MRVAIIAERGLFVRRLVQSGRFEQRAAEALGDHLPLRLGGLMFVLLGLLFAALRLF